jgi:cytochrome o ubiquinol oxidase subunit 2
MIPLKIRRVLLSLPLFLLAGCNKLVVMNPSGDIASQQSHLIVVSTVLMLLIIVPVIFLIVLFAWRYRKNAAARYEPDWDHSTQLELIIWGAPLLIIIALGLITWISTHALDPYRPLDRIDANRPISSAAQPMTIEVVAMDWKWLFIYPELGIATVNELATPIDVPVRFKLTSTTVMNSFYIPALAGQIYTMAGMETHLNAVMNEVGEYDGFSANYSGAGFSGMRFKYHGLDEKGFDNWVKKVRSSSKELDRESYAALEKPSSNDPVQYFGVAAPDLYHAILNRCVSPQSVCMDQMMTDDHHRAKTMSQSAKHDE